MWLVDPPQPAIMHASIYIIITDRPLVAPKPNLSFFNNPYIDVSIHLSIHNG